MAQRHRTHAACDSGSSTAAARRPAPCRVVAANARALHPDIAFAGGLGMLSRVSGQTSSVVRGIAMGKLSTILLLIGSNCFMTYAWYGHLKDLKSRALVLVILVSWGVAFFEYCLQVPANRIGYGYFSLPQLKVIQEIITMCVFALFCVFYMREQLRLDFVWAGLCLVGAAYFMFRGITPAP